MKGLNVRQESTKILENTDNTLLELGHSNFLQDTYEGKGNKSRNELLGLNQDKKLLHSKRKSQQKLQDNLQNGRRYLQMTYQIKG